jgi:uncharacterized protein
MSQATISNLSLVVPEQLLRSDGLQPVGEKERIVSIDVLRGFALLGILAMNIQDFSMISAAYSNPTAYGDLHGVNFAVWLLCHVLADEKFMTIFSMLFGAGIVLMTSHVEAAGRPPALLHYRRMGWLILFGLLHGFLLWSGDILFAYGASGLVAYWFRKLPPRRLLIAGLAVMAVACVCLTVYGRTSAHWSPAQLEQARQDLWMPSPSGAAREIAAYRGSWLQGVKFRVPDTLQMDATFFVYFTFWRVCGLMLFGMGLFKLRVFSADRSASLYWAMMALAVVVGIPVILYGTYRDFAGGWDFRYSFFYGAQFNYWASLLVSLGWVGAIMLVCRTPALAQLAKRLATVGRMAFSNYIMHTLICTTLFYGYGFAFFGKVERVWQFAIVVVIWAFQLAVSPIWLQYFLFGPLEWLWRSLTYWQREPFLRDSTVAQITFSPHVQPDR